MQTRQFKYHLILKVKEWKQCTLLQISEEKVRMLKFIVFALGVKGLKQDFSFLLQEPRGGSKAGSFFFQSPKGGGRQFPVSPGKYTDSVVGCLDEGASSISPHVKQDFGGSLLA